MEAAGLESDRSRPFDYLKDFQLKDQGLCFITFFFGLRFYLIRQSGRRRGRGSCHLGHYGLMKQLSTVFNFRECISSAPC